jgi:hypothetical protein
MANTITLADYRAAVRGKLQDEPTGEVPMSVKGTGNAILFFRTAS